MKTVLLLTKSVEIHNLFSEILDQSIHLVFLDPTADPVHESFDGLFAKWRDLADAVILDAASLGEQSRSALESMEAGSLRDDMPVVVRATAMQQDLYPMAQSWLVVSDTDSPDKLKQSLITFFEMRGAQLKLRHAESVITKQRHAVSLLTNPASHWSTPAATSHGISPAGTRFDSHRYAEALKSISRVVGQRHNEKILLTEFLRLVRELLGVGKLAIFMRKFETDLFGRQPTPAGDSLIAVASEGLRDEVIQHLRLSRDAGIGGYLAREARILRRSNLDHPLAQENDPQIAREFELFGTEVALPIFDNGQLLGVLMFSGKITGEPFTSEELELVYHLMAELAQAIHNLHLLDQIAGQQRFMSEVLANVQSGVVAIGHGRQILSLNPRARQLLGLDAQEFVGQKINRLPSRVADLLFEVMQTGKEVWQQEVQWPPANRPVAVSATRFAATPTSRSGQAEAENWVVVALVEDLTQAKLQQEQTRAAAEREFFTRLAARLSHELKNALVSIKIFAQLLPERYNESDFRDQFSRIVASEVNRVDLLINNLTFFAHPLELVYEEVTTTDWLETCLRNAAEESVRKQLATLVDSGEKPTAEKPEFPVISVKKNLEHKTLRFQGDKIRLMQAFEHILRNAVEAMPKGGRLIISTADALPSDFPDGKLPVGGVLRIKYQDTGEGIGLDNLKRVMEPFVTTRNVGVGLGLTIVKKIIEQHGGRVDIDSMLGRGTTVILWLPIQAQPQFHKPSPMERSAVAQPAALAVPAGLGDEKTPVSQSAADRLGQS